MNVCVFVDVLKFFIILNERTTKNEADVQMSLTGFRSDSGTSKINKGSEWYAEYWK